MLIDCKIDLTKVPKEQLFKSEDTGKIYLDFKVSEKQSPDQYNNTHSVYIQKQKEDEKIYIGSGKMIEFKPKESAPIQADDLPF